MQLHGVFFRLQAGLQILKICILPKGRLLPAFLDGKSLALCPFAIFLFRHCHWIKRISGSFLRPDTL
jgi:hypothetical protein